MASGTLIDELYISLGLDMTKFDSDYAFAQKEVKSAVAKLDRESRIIKAQMSIELAGYDDASNNLKALKVQAGYLNRELENQKKIVELSNKAHAESVKKYGEASAASQRLQETLLREKAQLIGVQKQLEATAASRAAVFSEAITGAGLAAGTGSGVIIKLAKDYALAINELTDITGLASEEASKLLAIGNYVKLTGEEVSSAMVKMSKSVSTAKKEILQAGNAGKESGDIFTEFGITILDSNKNLLPSVEILKNIAQAHRDLPNGIEKTNLELEIFGKSGAKMNDMLNLSGEQMDKIVAKLGKMGGTLTDETTQAWEDLDFAMNDVIHSLKMIGINIGGGALPILKEKIEVLEKATDGYNKMSESAQTAAGAAVVAAAEFGSLLALAKGASLTGFARFGAALLNPWVLAAAAIGITLNELNNYADAMEALEKKSFLIQGDKDNASVRMGQNGKLEKQVINVDPFNGITKDWEEIVGEELDAVNKKIEENNQKQADDAKKKTDAKKKQSAEFIKLEKSLQDEIYKITHSQVENEILDLENKAKDLRSKGLDEKTIAEYTELQKAEIKKKYAKDASDAIAAITNSDLTNRLLAIETERQAFIKKTNDEVTATKVAEEKKRQTVQEAALQALQQNKEELRILAKSGSMASAFEQILTLRRKNLGLDKLDFDITPQLIADYYQIDSEVKKQLLPGFENIGELSAKSFWAAWKTEQDANLAIINEALVKAGKSALSTESDNMANVNAALNSRGFSNLSDAMAKAGPLTTSNNVSYGNITINVPVTAVTTEADIPRIANDVSTAIEQKLMPVLKGGGQYDFDDRIGG